MIRAGGPTCLALLCTWLGLAAPVAHGQNVQPISTSLAECAAIFTEIAGLRPAIRRGAESQATLYDGARRFSEEAVRQASAEGISDPAAHVEALRPELAAKWSGRMSSIVRLGENRDWIDYCRALGEDRGILPLPG